MPYQVTALTNMYDQVLPKRRGRKDPRLPHGRMPERKTHVEGCRPAAPRRSKADMRAGRA